MKEDGKTTSSSLSSISFPQLDKMREDDEKEAFSGYDAPRGAQGGSTGGNGGRIRPREGNIAGAGNLGDSDSFSDSDNSDSPPPDPRKILAHCREHWDNARKRKYDRRYTKLLKLFKKAKRGKNSGPRQRKPEKLGIDPFDSSSTDTERFIQDVEIKLTYLKDSLVDDMDKICLVIPLLQKAAKQWYQGIHSYISKDAAKHEGKPFDPNNVLRTWDGFRTQLIPGFGGQSDRDRALQEWSQLVMRPGRIDHFIDEMVRLANVLGYSGEFVKDKARIGMTANLRHGWAHVDPPQEYMEYLDRLLQTGHQLENLSSFNQIVTKE